MLDTRTKYSYNDVTIIPARISDISSRSECIPTDVFGYYPLITAPMTSVVDEKTVDNFEDNKIYSVMPRSTPFSYRMDYGRKTHRWIAVSLSEFEDVFVQQKINEENFGMKILIDIANGHMRKLFDLVGKAKDRYGKKNIQVMVGNIANPETYLDVIACGADFCRLSVGTGSGCFVKGTKVLIEDRKEKNIEDIIPGDLVETTNGLKTVISVKKEKTNKVVKINNEVTCTLNHKFLVINKEDKGKINDTNFFDIAYYIEAEKLNPKKHLLIKNV